MNQNKAWSINKEDWLNLPTQLKGRWRNVKVNISASNLIPESSGVYMFCGKPPDIEGLNLLKTAFYIGKATNLRRRFNEHYRNNKKIKSLRDCYETLEFLYVELEPPEPDRNEESKRWLEKYFEQPLIRCFNPLHNEIDAVREGEAIGVKLLDKQKI